MSFSDWKEVKLGDVIDFNPSETIKKGALAKKVAMDKLNPYQRKVDSFEISKYLGGTKFRNGDTLMARITPCLENGKTAQINILNKNEVGFGSTEFIVLREKRGRTTNDFIYYLMTSPFIREVAIKSMTGTSGRQRAQKDVIKNTNIKLPPIDEQKAIAHILSTLDEKIEINNKIINTLETMAQEIFKHWFVDFEFPNENGEPYKSSGGEMIESELGLIPKGWEVIRLGEYINIKHGYAFKSTYFTDEETERILLTPVNFKIGGGFQNKKLKYYSIAGDLKKDYVLNEGDLIITMTDLSKNGDTLGYPAVIPTIKGKILLHNQRLGKVENKNSLLSIGFIYSLMCSKQYRNYVLATATGTTVKHTAPNRIIEYRFSIPCNTNEILHRFNSTINNFMLEFNEILSENLWLQNLRDTLLPKLMSGEIRVPLNF